MMSPHLARIRIYPIKALDPVELQSVEIGARSLRYDREFAMLTTEGRFMNGKRSGKVNELRAEYDLANYRVTLVPRAGGEERSFHLTEDKTEIETYLSAFFAEPISLLHNKQGRLLDMPDESCVTVVSEASLQSLQVSLNDLSLDDIRLRFRANLELAGITPFGEEKFFGEPGVGMRFKIGDVEMIGVSPRARCNVPPRAPLTGITDKTFVRRMMKSREASLPEDSRLPAHGGFYHLTVNTYLPDSETGKILRVGDKVEVLSPVILASSG